VSKRNSTQRRKGAKAKGVSNYRGPDGRALQPIIMQLGVARFKGNQIVQLLLDGGIYNMNNLALLNFSDEDREQFAQLIGYSVSGFGELSYASKQAVDAADKVVSKISHKS
jgi:hypothetical protein